MPSLNYLKANCEHLLACSRWRLSVGKRSILNCYIINSHNILGFLQRVHLLLLQIELDWLSHPEKEVAFRLLKRGVSAQGPPNPSSPPDKRSPGTRSRVGQCVKPWTRSPAWLHDLRWVTLTLNLCDRGWWSLPVRRGEDWSLGASGMIPGRNGPLWFACSASSPLGSHFGLVCQTEKRWLFLPTWWGNRGWVRECGWWSVSGSLEARIRARQVTYLPQMCKLNGVQRNSVTKMNILM